MLYEVITTWDGQGVLDLLGGDADVGVHLRLELQAGVGELDTRLDRACLVLNVGIVITSYSIHYTKLYDEHRASRNWSRPFYLQIDH